MSEVPRMTRRAWGRAGACLGVVLLCAGADGPPKAKESALAVLADRCLACHSAEVKKGGLDLTRRKTALAGGDDGPAIVPGQAAASPLVEKLEAGEMPPSGRLGDGAIAAVRAWVES